MTDGQRRAGNRARIWTWLLGHGMASRSEVADGVALSKVAVTNIVAELMEAGWVAEVGQSAGFAGRPAGLIDLHPDAGRVLGLDLQPSAVCALQTDLRGVPICTVQEALPGPDAVTRTVLALLESAYSATDRGPLRQVVVSVPAPVNTLGQPEEPSGLPQFDAPLVQAWCRGRALPLAFENDVKLAAVAEHRSGGAVGADNFALLAERDTGVALGLFLGGQLYRGDQGRAGELSALRWPGAGGSVLLESLPTLQRQAALAQLVGGLAVALDMRLLLVQLRPALPGASAGTLIDQLRALAPRTVTIVRSLHDEFGPLQGASLEAARLAQERLKLLGLTRPGLTEVTPA